MSEPIPKQTIHPFKLYFLHTSGFKFEAYERLRRGCRALPKTIEAHLFPQFCKNCNIYWC